jgi:hypothetical protein
MHKRTIIYNLQKIANILDDYELHKDADKITFVMQKIAQIDINSQNDLKIIKNMRKKECLIFLMIFITILRSVCLKLINDILILH